MQKLTLLRPYSCLHFNRAFLSTGSLCSGQVVDQPSSMYRLRGGVSSVRTIVSRLSSNSSVASYCIRKDAVQVKTKANGLVQEWLPLRFISTSSLMLGEIVEVEGPPFAESISEGDIRWNKQKGDFVNADEIIAEIETDKTSVEVPAQFSGTIVELLVEDGAKVTAKQKIYKLEKGGSSSGGSKETSKPAKKEEPKEEDKPKQEEKPKDDDKPKAEPIQKQQKPQERGQDQQKKLDDSKPKESAIPDKMPQVSSMPSKPISSKPTSDVKVEASKDKPQVTGDRTETRVKMNRMRQRIAERLKEAQNTNAMLTTFNEVDLTNVMEMRKKYQEAFTKKHNVKLGLMSPFVRASAIALQDQPVVNAVIEGTEIVYRSFCDISIAVATPKGLVVPVVRNVESMGYAEIEKTLAQLGAKARDGKIAIEDMEGGTFTISNGGVFGSVMGTPIINPPQSAILGMHGIFDRVVAIDGKPEVRPMMYIALTYDHRLIDGREAVMFLRKVKQSVEDPLTILLDL